MPNPRDIHGILLLDKPEGITSNTALQKAKKYFNARKAGHTGSLDPLASGMLPLCFGEATKFSQFLLNADKVYQVRAKLGTKTTTGDADGEIISEHSVRKISHHEFLKILDKFLGAIQQIPPMYSAVKHQGKRLYYYARSGIEIERKKRIVQIYKINLLAQTNDTFTLEVHCSKGTYIRTLIEDIGEALQCGAHVTSLRRTGIRHLLATQMITFSKLQESSNSEMLDNFLLPVDSFLVDLPEVIVSQAGAFYLQRGQPIIAPYAPASGLVRLKFNNGNFLGLGEVLSNGFVAPKRLITFIKFQLIK